MAKLVDGQEIAVGNTQQQIGLAFEKLQSGGSINFAGASGPLDFDLATGEAMSDILIWCLPEKNGMAKAWVWSGLKLNAETKGLTGAISPSRCHLTP